MKKGLIIFAILFGVLFALWVFARLTKTLELYSVPSGANEPTFKPGDHFFASNLKKPDVYDFIVYKMKSPEMGKYTAFHRLCGVEGDLVEIKNGDLYRNGIFADGNFNLLHIYKLSQTDYTRFADILSKEVYMESDSVMVNIPSAIVKEHKIPCTRFLLPKNHVDTAIGNGWNQDHYGPIKIPKDSYFVLGDHRKGSADSRYYGFVPKNKWIATVLKN